MNNKLLIFGLGVGAGVVLTLIFTSIGKHGKQAVVEDKSNPIQPNPKK